MVTIEMLASGIAALHEGEDDAAALAPGQTFLGAHGHAAAHGYQDDCFARRCYTTGFLDIIKGRSVTIDADGRIITIN